VRDVDVKHLTATGEVRVIPRAKHFPFIDEPEIFVAAIRDFRKAYMLTQC